MQQGFILLRVFLRTWILSSQLMVYDEDFLQLAEIEIVFDPPWSQDMMSDAAKLELGVMW